MCAPVYVPTLTNVKRYQSHSIISRTENALSLQHILRVEILPGSVVSAVKSEPVYNFSVIVSQNF